jgi:predicted transcriptional regulator
MFVHEAMSSTVHTCQANASLEDIARKMWDTDCGSIPVVDHANHPIGIVTDRDIAMAAMHNHQPLWELNAEQLIQGRQVYTSNQGESMNDCLSRMEQNEIRRMLVTDDSGALVGILSMGDALAATSPESAWKRTSKVSVDNVLGMLRKVSAHHANGGSLAARPE